MGGTNYSCYQEKIKAFSLMGFQGQGFLFVCGKTDLQVPSILDLKSHSHFNESGQLNICRGSVVKQKLSS